MNDLLQYEHDYKIQTKTRHRTPIVRTMSITNVEDKTGDKKKGRLASLRKRVKVPPGGIRRQESESSMNDCIQRGYDSSDSAGKQTILIVIFILFS